MIAASNFLSPIAFGQNRWTRQSPLPAARNLWGAAWATPTHVFASGESETLIETFDGGTTWHNVNLGVAPSDPFYNVYCRDADNCFVIGNGTSNGPDHWRTTNGGATWQQITTFPNGIWKGMRLTTSRDVRGLNMNSQTWKRANFLLLNS